jgi:antitoxin component YwqK of YwqJK toxin-antitoxin module
MNGIYKLYDDTGKIQKEMIFENGKKKIVQILNNFSKKLFQMNPQ